MAEKYALSEDGTTYTFTLREGVKFHNGQTVTAEDVVYSINRCAAVPEGQEKPLVAAFSAVKSVEALDEKTVAVTIAQRDLEFISYMTAAIIPADYEVKRKAPVGTRPQVRVPDPPAGLHHGAVRGLLGRPSVAGQGHL